MRAEYLVTWQAVFHIPAVAILYLIFFFMLRNFINVSNTLKKNTFAKRKPCTCSAPTEHNVVVVSDAAGVPAASETAGAIV